MFIKGLFWNIGKLDDYSIIGDLCRLESVDLLMTAEDLTDDVLKELNKNNGGFNALLKTTDRGIRYYSKRNLVIKSVEDDAYFSAKSISHPRIGNILIVVVHYPSKLHMEASDQKSFVSGQSRIIQGLEKRLGTNKTIVIGDFNSNPHEDAMLSADGMNAVCCSQIARKESRVIKGESYPFFYNPMWKFYTKDNGVGHGTCYWNPKGYNSIYWNIFDQVLFRPNLIDDIDTQILEYYQPAGNAAKKLMDFADHLPIKITIKI